MCCATCCSKFFLSVVNFLIFLIGLCALTLGILCTFFKTWMFTQISNNINTVNLDFISSVYIQSFGIGLIVLGAIFVVVGISGWLGACCEIKILLYIYGFICFLLFLICLAFAIFYIVYRPTIRGAVQSILQTQLLSYFDDNLQSANQGSVIWFQMMQTFGCCGWNGAGDFSVANASNFAQYWNSALNRSACPDDSGSNFTCYGGANVQIPTACCVFSNKPMIWAGNKTAAHIQDNKCPLTTSSSYGSTGCGTLIMNWAENYAWIVIGIAFLGTGIMFLALLATCLILFHIYRNNKDRYEA